MKMLLDREGFCDVNVSVVNETIKGLNAKSIAEGLVAGNPGIIEIRDRANAEPADIIDKLANEIECEFGSDDINIPMQEIVFSVAKPAA